jgi:hypothetical protein
MAVLQRTYAVALTIPDNEAFTALETLRRIGIPVGGIRRADIWSFEVDESALGSLRETIATVETVFNPNKHELDERPGSRPLDGEVWIAPRDERASPGVGGRIIPGVRGVHRRVAWRLFDESGQLVTPTVFDRAIETFLCNPAFQKAIR